MKKFILIGFCILLAGCGKSDYQQHYDAMKPLTNEQIVQQKEYCHTHGMRIFAYENSYYNTVRIECIQQSDDTTIRN